VRKGKGESWVCRTTGTLLQPNEKFSSNSVYRMAVQIRSAKRGGLRNGVGGGRVILGLYDNRYSSVAKHNMLVKFYL